MIDVLKRYRIDLAIALLSGAVAFGVYNATLTPSLSYKSPDGNELATIPYVLGLAHSTGYPLYTWLGKLFSLLPVGDVAHRINLMSAVMGAGAVALLYLVIRELTSNRSGVAIPPLLSRLASALTALLFAFSPTFWSQTGIAEVYAPNAFMLVLSLGLLLAWARAAKSEQQKSRWLFLTFCLSFGLSLGTHMSNLGFAPAFALFVLLQNWRATLDPVKLLGGTAAFGLGVAQFIWLPLRWDALNDRAMLRNAPNSLQGIYDYTLGAFPQFKFAFPLEAIPDRIVIYLDLMRQQFHLWGILLGVLGMWVLLWRWPRRFMLVVTMYLVHVFFFVQYAVFDLDVFFIPAHLLFALFIGVGVWQGLAWGSELVAWAAGERGLKDTQQAGLAALLALGLAGLVVGQVRANWATNDYSEDTAINDFYDNVWPSLPKGAVLLGRGGVFGYDLFYYRLVYDVRPDVLIPHLDTPTPDRRDLAGRPVYSTLRLDQANRGPGGLPPNLVARQSWHVPVLVGGGSQASVGPRRELILYRITPEPPELVVVDPQPQQMVNADLGGLTLVGYDLASETLAPGQALSLTLYWRMDQPRRYLIETRLGELGLERHELGFGNLQRYLQAVRPPKNGIIVETYAVVVPSTMEPGSVTLQVGLATMGPNPPAGPQVGLTEITLHP